MELETAAFVGWFEWSLIYLSLVYGLMFNITFR